MTLNETPAMARPRNVNGRSVLELSQLVEAEVLSGAVSGQGLAEITVTGVSLDSRSIAAGDLYLALPGAHVHGAKFAQAAVKAGAVAIITDNDGAAAASASVEVPVLVHANPRAVTGAISAAIYGTGDGAVGFPLFAVTGTNGKTTTTYFVNSLLKALGKTTGLIGTIEIVAGDQPIPSKLTTPESTDVHALLAVMRERGMSAASMEVSSHALAFGRVDGVSFDVAGFSNLTQDHLDLHGNMEDYFAMKAKLFTPDHARSGVVVIDDEWGRKLAQQAAIPVTTLSTKVGSEAQVAADWLVEQTQRHGIGSSFVLRGPQGLRLKVSTGLPGGFNVSNAALATVMVASYLLDRAAAQTRSDAEVFDLLQQALDSSDPFTVAVPGRMQLISEVPVAVVDFAHNPDALERAIEAVRLPEEGSKVIVVFGATGERDVTKRPIMGALAARTADVVLITDDDPHDEDPQQIRSDVLAGAYAAKESDSLAVVIEEFSERAAAIARAVELATPKDAILVAGRGHEVFQEVKGINVSLDDRVELAAALTANGFTPLSTSKLES